MQKKVVSVETVCDVCGDVITDTEPSVPLVYDGSQYLVDLCSKHKKELGGVLAPFISAARKIAGGPRSAPKAGARLAPQKVATSAAPKPATAPEAEVPAGREAPSAPMPVIRAWARSEGGFTDVPKTGILKPEVIQAFEAAHRPAQAPQPAKAAKKAAPAQAAAPSDDNGSKAGPKRAKGQQTAATAA